MEQESPSGQLALIPESRNWKRVVLSLLVFIVLAAAAFFFIHGHRAGEIVETANALGTPFVVATSSTPQKTSRYDDYDYIPWEVAVSNDTMSMIRRALASTTVSVATDKYGLFMNRGNSDSGTGLGNYVHYVEYGPIDSGKYAGYHLIIAIYPSEGPTPPDYLWFATKNYQSFVANGKPGLIVNPGFVNTQKVVAVDELPVPFPHSIQLGGGFGLSYGADVYSDSFATTGPSAAARYLGPVGQELKLYAQPQELIESLSMYQPKLGQTLAPYIDSTTKYSLCAKNGVCFGYSLAFSDFADQASSPYRPVTSSEYAPMQYQNIEVSPDSQDGNFYPTYANIYPYGCGSHTANSSYVLKNIQPTDVFDTGRSWEGIELYAFSHPDTMPVVRAMYDLKQKDEASIWDVATGTNTPMPDFETYIKQYPVLLFKDPWGQWVAVGENLYEVAEGCGKPVIYLYPTTPTPVRVSFERAPTFSVDIPTYHDGWSVFAEPNGILHDLQPGYTDCDLLDTSRRGSEYARGACASKTYPYLYWAGRADGVYPEVSGGWVVPKDQLDALVSTQLERIGFTQKESEDMRSFWVPTLLETNAPYYRVSFFTTAQMNGFIPMNVRPTPDSVLRVFLDWAPLEHVPDKQPKPQEFAPFVRHGFTLVEWGGLERNIWRTR